MNMDDLFQKLLDETINAKKIAIVGIGEEKLTDDAVGPYIITQLLHYNNHKFLIINCGIDMMNRMDEIIDFNPSHLILIDTCTFYGPPGTVVILKRNDLANYVPICSHTIPIHIVIDLIIEKLPQVNAFMIGIVPESLAGFDELQIYECGKYTIDELNENPNLPFFDIKLSKTIQDVAHNLIKVIGNLIEKINSIS